MHVTVTARNCHVSPELKTLATEKLERVQRIFDKITMLEIEFSEEHNPRIAEKHTVEVVLTTSGNTLRAHASAHDQHAAVDKVVDKLETQVRKLKEKIRGHSHRPGDKPVAPAGASFAESRNGREAPIDSDEDEAPAGGLPTIASVKRFAVKPMTPEEAVLQMQSLGHEFYLFVNAESEQAGVVYRRRDGSFGLIEPD